MVLNATQVSFTGNKLSQKIYYRHTGYTGHLRETPLQKMLETHPERVIEKAVKGMLPKNRLGRRMLGRLKVYRGATHPHQAQVNAGAGKPKSAQPQTLPSSEAIPATTAKVASKNAARTTKVNAKTKDSKPAVDQSRRKAKPNKKTTVAEGEKVD